MVLKSLTLRTIASKIGHFYLIKKTEFLPRFSVFDEPENKRGKFHYLLWNANLQKGGCKMEQASVFLYLYLSHERLFQPRLIRHRRRDD